MLPSVHSFGLAWLALISVTNLPASAIPINHTCKLSYNYHMRSKSFHMCITLWAHDIACTHIQIMIFLSVTRQAGWPQPLMSGTLPTAELPSLNSFRHSLNCLTHVLILSEESSWFLVQWSSPLWPLHYLPFIPEAHDSCFKRDLIVL